jgi:hypothetical protein
MTIIAMLFAAGAYGELYVARGERSPWGTLFVALVLQHSTTRAISHRIARSLSVSGRLMGLAT